MSKFDPVIALDGPSGSGKSTVARRVAERLQLTYIDTGAMFRAVAFALQHLGVDFTKTSLSTDEEAKIQQFFHDHRFSYNVAPGVLVELDNLNLTDRIREHHVSALASQVSKHAVVRDFLSHWQREIVKDRPAILDGRDIGTVIFPRAVLKCFLTASPEKRAERRLLELQERGEEGLDLAGIQRDIEDRDQQDMSRSIAPLVKAVDALEIDTSHLTVEQIVELVISEWQSRQGRL